MLSILVNVVGLVERERRLGFAPPILHLFLRWLNVITGVHDAPSDSGVFWRKVWVLLIAHTLLIESVARSFISLFSSNIPLFLNCVESLFEHWGRVGTLGSVTIDEDVAHI